MPVLNVTTSLPRITVNGWGSCGYTSGIVIDHIARTVSGAVFEMPENKPLTDLLRGLREDDVIDLKLQALIPGDDGEPRVEYEGAASPIMIRVRPTHMDVYKVKFRFRLLDKPTQ